MKDIGAVNATVATLVNTVTVCTSAVNEKLGPANSTKLELYPVVVSTALVNETVDAVGSGAIVKPAAKSQCPRKYFCSAVDIRVGQNGPLSGRGGSERTSGDESRPP